jgi:hypothetical protein
LMVSSCENKSTIIVIFWRSMVGWLGYLAQDQRTPGSSPGHIRSLYLNMFIKGRVVCGLPVMRTPHPKWQLSSWMTPLPFLSLTAYCKSGIVLPSGKLCMMTTSFHFPTHPWLLPHLETLVGHDYRSKIYRNNFVDASPSYTCSIHSMHISPWQILTDHWSILFLG